MANFPDEVEESLVDICSGFSGCLDEGASELLRKRLAI